MVQEGGWISRHRFWCSSWRPLPPPTLAPPPSLNCRHAFLILCRPKSHPPPTALQVVHSTGVFGCIRSLAAFRLTGAQRDYVIVGSDSGRIVILDYNKDRNVFTKVHQETFGRSGCRRIVPGQYVAADPKGRACIIGEGVPCRCLIWVGRGAGRGAVVSLAA